MAGFGHSKKNAMQQHRDLIFNYLRYSGGNIDDLMPDRSNYKTDLDVVYENNKFIWDDDCDDTERTWNERVAKKYWDQLNKEYVIADLSRYKSKQYAFRWRTEKEVVNGFGQFTCANKSCKDHKVNDLDGLNSFEVMFNYKEQGEKKSALVKVRVCSKCERKLNYHYEHKRAKKRKKEERKRQKSEANGDDVKIEIKDDDEDYKDEVEFVKKEESDVIFVKKENVKKESIVISDDEEDYRRRRSKSSRSRDGRDDRRDDRDRSRHRSDDDRQNDRRSQEDWRFDRESRGDWRARDDRSKSREKDRSSKSSKHTDDYEAMKNIWKDDATKEKTIQEKRDEQFDDYLNDLLL